MTDFSKYTDLYLTKFLSHIPEMYQENDTEGNMELYLNVAAEMFATIRLALDDLSLWNKPYKARLDSLKTLADNFGMVVDQSAGNNLRQIIALTPRWLHSKGMGLVIATYLQYLTNRQVEFAVIETYLPKCGDAGLLCNQNPQTLAIGVTPYWLCGDEEAFLSTSGNPFLALARVTDRIRLLVEGWNAMTSDEQAAFTAQYTVAIQFLLPIYIQFDKIPFDNLVV
jgi:hypothetical protein